MSRIEALLDLTRASPTDPFGWYALALEYRSAGRLDDAGETFSRLMADFPDYVPTYLMAGQFHAAAGRLDEARQALRTGIAAATRAGNAHARSEMESLLESLG